MQNWPFVVATLFVVFNYRALSHGRSIALFFAAVFAGYGILFMVAVPLYPLALLLEQLFFTNEFDVGYGHAVLVIYGIAVSTTSLLTWMLARQLRKGGAVRAEGMQPSGRSERPPAAQPIGIGFELNGGGIIAQGQLTRADYLNAVFLNARPLLFVGALLFCVAIWWLPNSRLAVLLACLVGIGALYSYNLLMARRIFRLYKALSEPVVIEMRDDGLMFKRTNSDTLVPWSHVAGWRKNDRLMLLYPTNIPHLIPAHFFACSEDFQSFTTVLASKIGQPA